METELGTDREEETGRSGDRARDREEETGRSGDRARDRQGGRDREEWRPS